MESQGGAAVVVPTAEEQRLFGLLLECARLRGNVVLRVAGGWVRDKLLGKESHDVDVVVEGMASEEFVELLCELVVRQGGVRPKVAVMEADPEHGKHLAACNAVVEGASVDFVSMRSGGLLEDARHRDLTINSLFYNMNRRVVEDMTEHGVADLRRGILRAPAIDPMLTLTHDPLRAVRVARFAATLPYAVDPALQKALAHPQLRLQLLSSTKRDRIGQELKKAFAPGARAAVAVEVLAQAGLFDVVMLGRLDEGYSGAAAAQRVRNLNNLMERNEAESVGISLVLAACLWELDCGDENSAVKFKEGALYSAVTGPLRLSHQEAEATVIVTRGARRLRQLPPNASRLQLGLWMRACSVLWKGAWMVAVAADADMGRVEQLTVLRRAVGELQLEGVWRMKPLLNGNQIGQLLRIPPGPVFATLTERLIEEQLKRPSMTYAEAEAFLRQQQQDLNIG
jgi:tRNA nucleotidyltransferase (CCA-adding enzyme)